MKHLFFSILFFLIAGKSVAQLCTFTPADTVYENSVSLITYNSARISGNGGYGDNGLATVILKYVRVGHTDTISSSTIWPNIIRNLTGLSSGTQYVYYYAYSCESQYIPQLGRYYFTTLTSTISYTPQFNNYRYPYIKFDSGLKVPRLDTSLYRAPNDGGRDIVFKTSDSIFYGYNGARWVPFTSSTSGISNKVDSVIVSSNGDSLFYWINGVSYGQIFNLSKWDITGNSGTTAGTNFIGTTDSVDWVGKTKGLERFRWNARGALALGTGTDYGTPGYALVTNGAGVPNSWVNMSAPFDATVDFSVNPNPNTGGTTFSPNTPQLTTKIYVSTINGSQWTWNGSAYTIYTSISWSTFGNAGTNATDNFIGTTDLIPLRFRVNNENAGTLDPTNGSAAFGYSTINSFTGSGNSAFGTGSLSAITTGSFNTGIGLNTLGSTNTNNSIGIGASAGNLSNKSNRLYIHSLVTSNDIEDSTNSIIHGIMDANPNNQELFLNSGKVAMPYLPTTVQARVAMVGTDGSIYSADTTGLFSGGGGLTVGTTAIASGTNNNVLYNNSGTLGEYTTTGTGTVVVKSTSPTITTSLNINGTGLVGTFGVDPGVIAIGSVGTNLVNAFVGGYAASGASTSTIYFGQNVFFNGSTFVNPSAAENTAVFLMQTGNHYWYTGGAGSGAGTIKMELSNAGALTIPNLAGATNGRAVVASTTGALSAGAIVASGTYTPTLTNVTNVSASTAYDCQYLRVGNTVTVSGKVDIDVTLGAASELGLSLPISSAMTAEENLGGTASSSAAASLVSAIRADATNDRAAFVFTAISLTNDSYFFEFTYQIK